MPWLYAVVLAACGSESVEQHSRPLDLVSSQHSRLYEDDHGDAPSEATPVLPNTLITGTLDFHADEDVFSFTAQAQRYYRFDCVVDSPATGWIFYYYNAQHERSGTAVVFDPPGYGLYFKARATEAAYVSIRAPMPEIVGPYSCQITELGMDDHADTATSASPWAPGNAATGIIEYAIDTDVFSLPLQRGAFYRVRCESAAPNECQVKVTSPVGTITPPGMPTQTASFNAIHSGTYLVEVTMPWTSTPVLQSAYTLHLDLLETDDHADTLEHATALTPSSTSFTGKLSGALDQDVFTFTATQGRVYRFACDVLQGGSSGPTLLLRNAAGAIVDGSIYNQNRGTTVSVETPATGAYFVELSHGSYDGPYSCALEDLGFDDHGDSAVVATPVSLSTVLTGHLETRTDVDAFAFAVQAGRIYRFERTSGTASSILLQLRNAQGQLVQTGGYGALTYEAPESAVYTFEVRLDSSTREPGTFVIQAVDRGPDDHGNTPASATLLAPGQPVSGWLHRSEDKDVFVFQAQEQTLYQLYCTGCEVTLESPTGWVRRLHLANPARIFIDPLSTGPIYVTVNQGFTYEVLLEIVGIDDHGDDVGHATPITYPLRLMGMLESRHDVDVFAVELPAGQPRRTNSPDSWRTIQVLDPTGQPVPVDFSGGFTPQVSGVHHLLMRLEGGPYLAVPYQLLLD
ncbi:hypothetical protein MFU01_51860 [Myxococcus fulvus]|uniref:Peptidase C-terminal archaeal/bacterial domain-containing protein n=1 Tax=Myxococcus fulvus TaxID=33 RepID=A0A511T7L4_MYXFU|nr:hypothetical protein MFU01_51860 [Myxococcus fulvus]